MLTSNEIINLFLPGCLILLVLIVLVRISSRLRKRGGSLTSILFGATFEFYNKDRQKASEVIVEERSGKKQHEQDSGDSEGDTDGDDADGVSIKPDARYPE
jgi:hypothetical protein